MCRTRARAFQAEEEQVQRSCGRSKLGVVEEQRAVQNRRCSIAKADEKEEMEPRTREGPGGICLEPNGKATEIYSMCSGGHQRTFSKGVQNLNGL